MTSYFRNSMAHTRADLLSRGKSVIAVAGATGKLGKEITETLLSANFKPYFSKVVILTRDTSSPAARSLVDLGAEARTVSFDSDGATSLPERLEGVDVLVNVLSKIKGNEKETLFDAAVQAGVRVYFTSEFGVDHNKNDFPGFDHKEWIIKREHFEYATKRAAEPGVNIKVVSVYVGLFLEDSIIPFFGFDIAQNTFTILGSPETRVTFTSKKDIGRSIARLAFLSVSSSANSVPSHVRICGTAASAEDIANAVTDEIPSKKIRIVSLNLEKEKLKLKEGYLSGQIIVPATHIRVIMGEGKLDFSKDNQNDLVNPNGMWQWKSFREQIHDFATSGRL